MKEGLKKEETKGRRMNEDIHKRKRESCAVEEKEREG